MPIAAGLYYNYHPGGSRERPPVLLLHGAAGSHLSWPAAFRRLEGYRVFAPDLPGHGRSNGPAYQSVAQYADHLVEFLTAAGLDQAALVGHSLGGLIALHLALNARERVSGLILLASGARLTLPSELLAAAYAGDLSTTITLLGRHAFGHTASPRLIEMLLRRLNEVRPAALYADLRAVEDYDALEQVGAIRRPLLVVCAGEDSIAPPGCAHYLKARVPGARAVILPGAGHMLHLEQPAATLVLVRRFLDGLSYNASSPPFTSLFDGQ
jgi:pimeloyl-ACP methyl ester carboxylesterase